MVKKRVYDLYIPTFHPNERGHGGEKWCAFLAKSCCPSWIRFEREKISAGNVVRSLFLLAISVLKTKRYGFLVLRAIVSNRAYNHDLKKAFSDLLHAYNILRSLRPGKTYLIDWHNSTNRLLPIVLHQNNIVFDFGIQNIESLVYGQYENKFEELKHEIKCLSLARDCITTGSSDTHLLGLFGVRSEPLNYKPDRHTVRKFLAVRRYRKPLKHFSGYLIFGSYRNPPTAAGMREIIANYPVDAEDLIVAGFGSERLLEENSLVLPSNVVVLGTVEEDVLMELLSKVKAVIVFQPPTTGTVLKFNELLYSGVPIFCNWNALRGSMSHPSIRVFNTLDNLLKSVCRIPKKSILDGTALDIVSRINGV